MIKPRRFLSTASESVNGLGCTPATQTTPAVFISRRSFLCSSVMSFSVTRTTRVSVCTSTRSFSKASSTNLRISSPIPGTSRSAISTITTRGSPRRARRFTASRNSAAIFVESSTPLAPPPTTAKVSALRVSCGAESGWT